MIRRVMFAVALVVLSGCDRQGPRQEFQTLDPHASALRDAFNRDIGKTRLVLLLSPS